MRSRDEAPRFCALRSLDVSRQNYRAASAQVPGCGAAIEFANGGRGYCFRYRVCETHLRADCVSLSGDQPVRWYIGRCSVHQRVTRTLRRCRSTVSAKSAPGTSLALRIARRNSLLPGSKQ